MKMYLVRLSNGDWYSGDDWNSGSQKLLGVSDWRNAKFLHRKGDVSEVLSSDGSSATVYEVEVQEPTTVSSEFITPKAGAPTNSSRKLTLGGSTAPKSGLPTIQDQMITHACCNGGTLSLVSFWNEYGDYEADDITAAAEEMRTKGYLTGPETAKVSSVYYVTSKGRRVTDFGNEGW